MNRPAMKEQPLKVKVSQFMVEKLSTAQRERKATKANGEVNEREWVMGQEGADEQFLKLPNDGVVCRFSNAKRLAWRLSVSATRVMKLLINEVR
jgi:hypothetical protein